MLSDAAWVVKIFTGIRRILHKIHLPPFQLVSSYSELRTLLDIIIVDTALYRLDLYYSCMMM